MRTLFNDPAARRACYADKTSARNSASAAFLDSYLSCEPATEPEDFDVCPVLLTQPGLDQLVDPVDEFCRRLSSDLRSFPGAPLPAAR